MRDAHIRAAMAMALMGSISRGSDAEAFELRPAYTEPPTKRVSRNRPRRARVAPGTPLHEQPHPLYGEEPENGKERALVREWEQAKRRAELYANRSKNDE